MLLIFCTFSALLLFWMSSPVFPGLLLKTTVQGDTVSPPQTTAVSNWNQSCKYLLYSSANESNDMIHGRLGFTVSMVTITIPTSPDIGTNLFSTRKSHWFLLTHLHESQLLLDGEDEYWVWFILPNFGTANFICSLKALLVILFMDPEMVPIYFQTGGETYEYGWISWGET